MIRPAAFFVPPAESEAPEAQMTRYLYQMGYVKAYY